MRDAAPKPEMLGPFEPEETGRIHIGQIGTDNQRWHAQPRLLLEARLPHHCADKAVR